MSSPTLKQFLDGRSLFTEINAVEAFTFIGENIDALDAMLGAYHGQKNVFIPMVDCALPVIAKMMVVKMGRQWRDLVRRDALDLEATTRREVTETISDSEARTTTRDDLEKVSAYDSDTLVTNSGVGSTGGDTLEGEKVRILLDEEIDLKVAYAQLSNSAKDSIIETVLNDVSGFLTLSIY